MPSCFISISIWEFIPRKGGKGSEHRTEKGTILEVPNKPNRGRSTAHLQAAESSTFKEALLSTGEKTLVYLDTDPWAGMMAPGRGPRTGKTNEQNDSTGLWKQNRWWLHHFFSKNTSISMLGERSLFQQDSFWLTGETTWMRLQNLHFGDVFRDLSESGSTAAETLFHVLCLDTVMARKDRWYHDVMVSEVQYLEFYWMCMPLLLCRLNICTALLEFMLIYST